MGEPTAPDPKTSDLRSVSCEIISAMSSLNMDPEPIEKESLSEDAHYLSETDRWAKHAMAHLHAAMAHMKCVDDKWGELDDRAWQAERKLLEERAKHSMEMAKVREALKGLEAVTERLLADIAVTQVARKEAEKN